MSFRAISIFALCYLIIIAGEHSPRKLDRPAAGLVGAVLMVVLGVLSRQEAVRAIDFPTLSLLLGMMIVIYYATISGLLNTLAEALLERCHSPRQLLWMVCLVSGILSALFINDTVCLLMTPLLLTAAKRARLNAEPFLLGLATSSNVGSVMTLTGNPQNILIGQSSAWPWAAFALRMAPVGLVGLAINTALIGFLYRKTLSGSRFVLGKPEEKPEHPFMPKLAVKTLAVLAGLLISFVCGVPLDLSALVAAAILLVWADRPSEETLNAVDWPLLLFFAGLFVLVEGVTKTQAHWLARVVPAFTDRPESLFQIIRLSFGSVVGSNLFSNVPFVMLLRGFIAPLPHARVLWLVLAMSSTFAGNLTMIGSVANLIVAQRALKECPLSFWAFLRVGVPSTIATTFMGALLLWIYYALHWA
jgi:Na+/H+ antiporter NhaD/arsenite permease-like protein